MTRSHGLFLGWLCLIPHVGISQSRAVSVAASQDGAARITFADGSKTTIPKERAQVGISEAQIAPDGNVGWLAEFNTESVSYPIAGTLVLWRAGKTIRRFGSVQTFYSWSFYAQGKQVAYHVGPLHGEQHSHCELHDIATGARIAQWDGDLDAKSGQPAWTKDLNH